MKYSRPVLLQFHMLLNLCIILTTLLGTTLLATSTPIPANQEVKAQGNKMGNFNKHLLILASIFA